LGARLQRWWQRRLEHRHVGGAGSSSGTLGTNADSTTATITVATPPTIMTQPQSQTVASGTTAVLSVTATGTAPLSYQWYVGSSGTTTNPIAGATAQNYTTPALMTTTTYWVRVSNAAGSANSMTVTITVMPPIATTDPAITTQPQSQTIAPGTTAALSVTATGTAPISYQWYVGSSGTTTNAIAGATGPNYTTPALTTTTSYWVRVSNACGTVDSTTAIVATVPGKVTNPAPSNGATGVSATPTLTWTAGAGAATTSYDVYFGTTVPSSPTTTTTGTSYTPAATLSASTQYQWRIDAKSSAGTTTGDVWTLTTAVGPNLQVAFSPSPAPFFGGLCPGFPDLGTNTWRSHVTVTETNGAAFVVSSFSNVYYDPSGNVFDTVTYNSFTTTFAGCGPTTQQIPPYGQVCSDLCWVLPTQYRSGGVQFVFKGTDLVGRPLTFTSLVLTFLPH
jgi:hypothetical protein